MAQTWSVERDLTLRHAAMAWLTVRTNDGLDAIHSDELRDFSFEGIRMPLMDIQRGIRKPAALSAALSIRTVYRAPGEPRPYEDSVGPDGLIRYKWRGDKPDHAENRALRAAMAQTVPLIWFFGVGAAKYQPIFPVHVQGEEPALQQFLVTPPDVLAVRREGDTAAEEQMRRYLLRLTRQRVHQPVFRATVMRAYATSCAVCAIRHSELLDAAHIVADSDEQGIASIRNGMALCKIHHAAFDAKILGISPDLIVRVRADLLEEIDGPMLQYGLKERHNQRLMVVPAARRERPDRQLLELRYSSFLSAS